MRKWLTWWLITTVNKKPAPDLIPMGGNAEKIGGRDYFVLHVSGDDGSRYLFRQIDQGGLKFSRFTEATHAFDQDVFLSLNEATDMEFVCTFYYRASEFKFTGRLDFFLYMSLGLWRLHIQRYRLSQWIFNRKTLSTTKRFEMMKFICDQKLSNPAFSLSIYSRAMSVYGNRVWVHPDRDSLWKKEEFLLDSLVSTGDLHKNLMGTTYRIDPKILVSLEALELDDRRTRRANRIQWALWAVGLFSAFAAGIQAWVAFRSQQNPSPVTSTIPGEHSK